MQLRASTLVVVVLVAIEMKGGRRRRREGFLTCNPLKLALLLQLGRYLQFGGAQPAFFSRKVGENVASSSKVDSICCTSSTFHPRSNAGFRKQ
jgi:hypothetical protein